MKRTIEAAGHTWHHVERGTGPGCWHQDSEGGRCLSLQGVIDEHTSWVWLQAREQPVRSGSLFRRVLCGLLGVR